MYNHLTLQMYDLTLTALAGYVGKADEPQRHQPWSGCRFSNKGNSRPVQTPVSGAAVVRRLRYRSTSGYAWFAISDGTSSLQQLPYAPTASQQTAL